MSVAFQTFKIFRTKFEIIGRLKEHCRRILISFVMISPDLSRQAIPKQGRLMNIEFWLFCNLSSARILRLQISKIQKSGKFRCRRLRAAPTTLIRLLKTTGLMMSEKLVLLGQLTRTDILR